MPSNDACGNCRAGGCRGHRFGSIHACRRYRCAASIGLRVAMPRVGHSPSMESNAGRHPTSSSAAALGGRLIQLAGDRHTARFSCEVSRVCAEPHPTDGGSDYGEVLAWVVDAIVDVIIARLGAAGPGERFILELIWLDFLLVVDLPDPPDVITA